MWRVTTATVDAIVRIFYDSQARKEVSGVVGSYETTRQSIDVRHRAGALRSSRSSRCRWRSSTCSRSCRSTAATSSGRWPRRSAAGRSRSASWSGPASSGFMLVLFLFVVGLTNDIGATRRPGVRRQPVASSRADEARTDGAAAPDATRREPRRSREAFRITAAQRAGRVAVRTRTRDDEVTLTWGELRERVDALAGGLRRPRAAAGRMRRAACSATGPSSTSATSRR